MRSLVLLVSGLAATATALWTPQGREIAAATPAVKYYDTVTGFNFTQFTTSNINYGIAIPSTATKGTPYQIVLQVVAPLTGTGWAGIAWGGQMANNPLTIVWANGQSAMVSSRKSSGYSVPTAYTGATYTVLPTSKVNSTHIRADLLCSGCSQWIGSNNAVTALDPTSTGVTLAYAMSSKAVSTPSSNTSSFSEHSGKGQFTLNLASAANANFATLVAKAQNATKTS